MDRVSISNGSLLNCFVTLTIVLKIERIPSHEGSTLNGISGWQSVLVAVSKNLRFISNEIIDFPEYVLFATDGFV